VGTYLKQFRIGLKDMRRALLTTWESRVQGLRFDLRASGWVCWTPVSRFARQWARWRDLVSTRPVMYSV